MLKIKIEEEKNIIQENQILLFDQPSRISIFLNQNNQNYLPLIKKGDYVYQEEKIALRKKDHFPLYSSISGIVVWLDSTKIIIKNDFKNRVRDHKMIEYELEKYTKEEISKILFELGISNIGKQEIEPYLKFAPDHPYKSIIINALKEEPYLYLESFQLKIEKKQLLEVIEAMIEIYNLDDVCIMVSNQQKLLAEEWKQCIKDFKIKVIETEEYYALSNTRELMRQFKHLYYQKDPIEKGYVVLNVSTLFAIYQALKYRRPQIKMLVQFTGNMWKKNYYMEVRVGTYLKEAIQKLDFKRSKEVLLLSGGLLKGKPQNLEHAIIHFEQPIYSAWKSAQKNEISTCIRCQRCIDVCPMHLNPALIINALQKKKSINRFQIERCIECGLCSYVCPVNIPLQEWIQQAKRGIK